jgi:hypothetical protein
MGYSTEDRAVQRFFLRQGLSQGVLRWVSFRTFLTGADWQARFSAGHSALTSEPVALLEHWQQIDQGIEQHVGFFWLINLLAILFGALAMTAVLTTSGSAPINLWWLFALFAFLPLLMTLVSTVSLVRPIHVVSLSHSPLVQALIRRTGFAKGQGAYGRILSQWALWQLQSVSVLLLVSALVTFFVVATFRDLNFGWSSTLIEQDQTMVHLVQLLALPWQWLMAAPSEQLITASRYYQGEGQAAASQLGQWWPTLIGSILCYGLIPRLILALSLRARLVRSLKHELACSGEIARLLNSLPAQASDEPLSSSSATLPDCVTVTLPTASYSLIGWQLVLTELGLVRNLGLATWAEDERWLAVAERELSLPILVLVQAHQTPTGELADCLRLLGRHPQGLSLGVVLADAATERSDAQVRSWRFFAQQYGIQLVQVRDKQHD